MNIDVVGAPIYQSEIEQPLDLGALAYVAKLVDAHVVGIVGTHRDEPVAHNLRNDIRRLETLTGLGMKKDRAWRPIDACGLPK